MEGDVLIYFVDDCKTNDFELTQLRKTIGRNIRNRRKSLNMRQEHLAFLIGYERAWIVRLERGQVSIKLEFLPRFQEALKLSSPLDLLNDSRLHQTTETKAIQIAINQPKKNLTLVEPEQKTLAALPS